MLEDAKKVLHPLNLFLIKGLDEAFEMCIQMNDFETALKYGIDTLPGFR